MKSARAPTRPPRSFEPTGSPVGCRLTAGGLSLKQEVQVRVLPPQPTRNGQQEQENFVRRRLERHQHGLISRSTWVRIPPPRPEKKIVVRVAQMVRAPDCESGDVDSIPIPHPRTTIRSHLDRILCGSQAVRRPTVNRKSVGSIPTLPAI